jgi:hypothetical protein
MNLWNFLYRFLHFVWLFFDHWLIVTLDNFDCPRIRMLASFNFFKFVQVQATHASGSSFSCLFRNLENRLCDFNIRLFDLNFLNFNYLCFFDFFGNYFIECWFYSFFDGIISIC